MRISEMLNAIASWLESPDNEALLLAEYDEDCMKIVVESCFEAAALLKKTAEEVDLIEPEEESKITSESLDSLADLSSALDSSNDPELMKQAAVLDELLLTIASPPNALAERKDLLDQRAIDLKKKYEQPRKDLEESNKVADSKKAIDKSQMTKQFKIMEAPLSSRYCPDHAGVQIARVGENMWQCEMDKKTYNFETGFTLNNGSHVPGGDVSNQTQGLDVPTHALFDTREGRLSGTNKIANSKNQLLKTSQGLTQAESFFMKQMEAIKQTKDWHEASLEKQRDIESDLKEAIIALMGETQEMGSSFND